MLYAMCKKCKKPIYKKYLNRNWKTFEIGTEDFKCSHEPIML